MIQILVRHAHHTVSCSARGLTGFHVTLRKPAPSQAPSATVDEQQIARNVQALKNRLRGRGGKRGGGGGGGRSALARNDSGAGSGRESYPNSEYVAFISSPSPPFILNKLLLFSSDTTSKRKPKGKVQRKWGNEAPTESDMATLDFSYDKPSDVDSDISLDVQALVDQASLGTRTNDGLYEVKDWEFGRKADEAVSQALNSSGGGAAEKKGVAGGSLGALGSMFARLTGSKVLTEEDLKPVLEGMKQHLMKKNVAMDIAEKVCEGVGESLVGKKVGGFQSMFIVIHFHISLAY